MVLKNISFNNNLDVIYILPLMLKILVGFQIFGWDIATFYVGRCQQDVKETWTVVTEKGYWGHHESVINGQAEVAFAPILDGAWGIMKSITNRIWGIAFDDRGSAIDSKVWQSEKYFANNDRSGERTSPW